MRKVISISIVVVVALVLYFSIFVGIGPIRRVGQMIVPDVLHNKVTVNSVCADKNRIYVFQGDNGDFQIQVVANGCATEVKD